MSTLRGFLTFLLAGFLASCGGDSDGWPSFSPDSGDNAASGRAVKGVLQYAEATLYQRVSGNWALVESTLTNAQGEFEFASVPASPVRIVISAALDGSSRMICDADNCGAAGIDAGDINGNGVFDFGESLPLEEDFSMVAILPAERPPGFHIAVTPMTHLAATFVEQLPGEINDQVIGLALNQVASLFDLATDFAWQAPLALTDLSSASEIAAVEAADIQQALINAGFAALSSGTDIRVLLDAFANQFAGLGGQLPVTGETSIQALALAAQQVASLDASLVPALVPASLALQQWAQRWSGEHTTVPLFGSVNTEDLARARTSLDQLEYYLKMAGIDENANFLATQAPQVDWLYNEDLLYLAQTSAESVLLVIQASIIASLDGQMGYPSFPAQMDIGAPQGLTAIYTKATKELSVQGERNGQTVAVTFKITPIFSGLQAGYLEYAVQQGSSIENASEVGELTGVLQLEFYNLTELSALTSAFLSADQTILTTALEDFLQTLHVKATVEGSASIAKTEDRDFGFLGSISAWGEINLPALTSTDDDFIQLHITSGQGTSPYGDRIYSLDGAGPALHLSISDQADLETNFGFDAFGMPAMEVTAEGYLSGLSGIMAQVATSVAELDPNALLLLAQSLDLSGLSLHGTGTLNIPADGKQWQFVLDGNRFDASQPNSTENALSFYVTSFDGGYIYSGTSLIATVTFDWNQLGATIYYVDGVSSSYFLGPLEDIIYPGVIESAASFFGF